MRVSDSTVIYENKSGKFLINFPEGNIDKMGSDLSREISILQDKATFENPAVSFSTKTLNYLKKRKYITSLSPWEEKRENEKKIEKKKARAKIQHKHRSIVLDPEIGSAWCHFNESNEQRAKDLGSRGSKEDPIPILDKILDKLKEGNSNEIDIWLGLEKRENDWKEIYSFLQEKELTVDRVWSVVNNDKESYFKDWARDYLFSEEIGMSFKTLDLGDGKYYENASGGEFEERNLWAKRLTALFQKGETFLTCPFIYRTVFASEDLITYCAKEVQRKEDNSQEDVNSRDKNFEKNLSTTPGNQAENYNLTSPNDFTCPKLTDKFKSAEDYYQAFFQRILDKTISDMSISILGEESD